MSLRNRTMLMFFGIMALITLLFFGMNTFFWKVIYPSTNRKTLKTVYEDIAEKVRSGDETSSGLSETLNNVRTGSIIYFALQGEDDWDFNLITREIASVQQQEFLKQRLQEDFLMAEHAGVRVLEQDDLHTLQFVKVTEEEQYYECYGYMVNRNGELKKFIFSMPLDRTFRTYGMINRFFLILSLVVLVLGTIVIFFVSNRVTKPIRQLTDISDRMKNLDFSARYTGDKKDEIGVLGNNMNELSSQLERTILKLRLANEELSKDLEEKEHVDEMRKDFISSVSHELKTPIALIQGYAEGLSDLRDDPESFRYYCDVIVDEADKMNRMVKKLMTLNQLEFGNADFQPEVFDIIEMLRSILSANQKKAEEKGAVIECRTPERLTVLGDPFEIEEVVTNYLSNAFNHLAAPNRITFTVEDLGPTARISVENTGKQIPESDLDKIWTKFYKVDRARTRSYGGSGIGLSIVKAIMNAHHQECGVYNVPDGVVFWFELQRAEEAPGAEAERQEGEA